VGQALTSVCYWDATWFSKWDSDNMDIFLNQLIQFYSNNRTNLHHLTSYSVLCCPATEKQQITVTSLQMVPHLSSNQAWWGVTSLMWLMLLLLRQTATLKRTALTWFCHRFLIVVLVIICVITVPEFSHSATFCWSFTFCVLTLWQFWLGLCKG